MGDIAWLRQKCGLEGTDKLHGLSVARNAQLRWDRPVSLVYVPRQRSGRLYPDTEYLALMLRPSDRPAHLTGLEGT